MENPSMFPVAGRHGSGNDAEAFQAAQAAGLSPARPGDDILASVKADSRASTQMLQQQQHHDDAAAGGQPPGTVQVTTADGRVEFRPIATRAVSSLEAEMAADGHPMAEMVQDPEVQRMLREMSTKAQGGSSDSGKNSR